MAATNITFTISLDSKQFERDLKRLHRMTRRASRVPEWCYVPWARWFIVANALAAPLVTIVAAVTR